MMFEVMREQCAECLLGEGRIVSSKRASQILRDCARKDTHFECHKGTMVGRHIACRAHSDRSAGQMARIAERLGMVRFVDASELDAESAR